MAQQNNNTVPKQIKTVLLCKVRPEAISKENDYPKVYRNIYCGNPEWAASAAEKYITIGSVDAVSIYDTVSEPYSNNWFQGIYDDKQNIIRKINENVTYHPIHLISNAEKSDAYASRDDFPFCVITLIYGIHPRDYEKMEESATCSRYEAKITAFLQNQEIKSEEMCFTAFNAVNICDAVIIWHTNDISKTLELANRIVFRGLSRKTYTIVGFPMSEDGTVMDKAYNSLPVDELFDVRIQGSIRQYEQYLEEVKAPLLKTIPDKNRCENFLVYGSEDFMFQFKEVNTKELMRLLPFLLKTEHGDKIASACWDLFTEFMLRDKTESGYPSCPAPVGILSEYYQNFLRLSSDKPNLTDYSWYGAFCEVLSVYSKIDQHPILYGPCYLIYDIIRITYYYLNNEDYINLIKKSQDSIQEFLRNWSEFTDQMTRIDDLVFHGFGSTSALFNTLPESALDFYHAFLLQCVDLLVAIDREDGRLIPNPNEYAYDFLLVPELYNGISIRKVFNTNVNEKNQEIKQKKRPLLPLKQVYLVRFPIKTVYNPSNFFAPLMHECFHYFGDACRLRRDRKSYIIGFLTTRILLSFERGRDTDTKLFHAVYKKLFSFFPDDIPEPNDQETLKGLENCIQQFFTPSTFDSLYAELEDDSFYTDKFMLKWINAVNMLSEQSASWEHKSYREDWNSVFYDCIYFFKECYADLMMILTLQLSPHDYLTMFEEGFRDALERLPRNNLFRDTQRVAIVLAACSCQQDKPDWTICEVTLLLRKQKQLGTKSKVCLQCVEALTDHDISYKKPDYRLHPPAVLGIVRDYLKDVEACYRDKYEQSRCSDRLNYLRQQYKEIFKEGAFFSCDFFDVIHEHHQQIRDGITLEDRLNKCCNKEGKSN